MEFATDFEQLFYNTLNECIGSKAIKFSDIKLLYNDLRILDNIKLIQIIKLISFIKYEMELKYNYEMIHTSNYFDTKLEADIRALIKANQTNNKILGYSPLIGYIFRFYIYLNKFKKVKKFQALEQQLLNEWNSFTYNENINDKSVKFFYRLYMKQVLREPFKKLNEMNIKEKRLANLKQSVEDIFIRKLHSDTFYKLFIKILVERNITNELLANKILKQMFNYDGNYIDSNSFQEREVLYIFNRIKIHLNSFCNIN